MLAAIAGAALALQVGLAAPQSGPLQQVQFRGSPKAAVRTDMTSITPTAVVIPTRTRRPASTPGPSLTTLRGAMATIDPRDMAIPGTRQAITRATSVASFVPGNPGARISGAPARQR
jgi:hypothetical protein